MRRLSRPCKRLRGEHWLSAWRALGWEHSWCVPGTPRRPRWLQQRKPSGRGQSERQVKADLTFSYFVVKSVASFEVRLEVFGVGRGDEQGGEMI